jgi:two-component sensor histidine kinase
VIENVANAEIEPQLKETVQAEEIGALAFIPLVAQGRLAGKFMMYYRSPHVFEPNEVALALTIARQLGFAIERNQMDRTKELLLQESRHRIKNTIATVEALAAQTLKANKADARESFVARLRALGEAHDLLTIDNWDRACVADIVERALKPFRNGHSDRIVVAGPPLWIAANEALLLTMCLHELATNAAKYGALTETSGRVQVSWTDGSDDTVKLSWSECGGPEVIAPARKGFGTRLIETSFKSSGRARIEYRREGISCSFELRR